MRKNMKYYKATDSRGNEWATSRKNPDQVVRYLNLLSHIPYASWTASPNKDDYIVEVQTNIVEIDAKEYRAIMKKRPIAIEELENDLVEQEAIDNAEITDLTEYGETSWIDDHATTQFTEEKITLRLTLQQLCKLTIQTDITHSSLTYDPDISEGVMDMLREKRLEVEAKQIAFRDFCEVVSEKFGTDNVADAKELLKIPNNKKIFNKYVRIYKKELAAK